MVCRLLNSDTRGPRTDAAPGDRARTAAAFTLVEALVVIAVVALLLAIVAPSLRGARDTARDAGCLSNLRQIGAAWLVYTNDYGVFPVADVPGYWGTLRFGWGGVNWFGDGSFPPGYRREPSERPINVYLAGSARIERPEPVFLCPRDTGCANARTGDRPWDTAAALGAAPAEFQRTCYGMMGTSYDTNDWLYCSLNARLGWGFAPVGQVPPNFTILSPASVVIAPSRCIMVGDEGATIGGRMEQALRVARNQWTGFWHGSPASEQGQLVFLDGSARRERGMHTTTSPTFTFFPNPAVHPTPVIRMFVDTW